jgi:cobaltochelatase CobN
MCPASHDAAARVMADWMYEQLTERYVLDPENRKFMNESNPPALHKMSERLLEAVPHILDLEGATLERD